MCWNKRAYGSMKWCPCLSVCIDEVKRKGGRTEGGWLLWPTANVYVLLLAAAAPDGLPAAWQTPSWHQRLLCTNRGVCRKIFLSIHHGKSLQAKCMGNEIERVILNQTLQLWQRCLNALTLTYGRAETSID